MGRKRKRTFRKMKRELLTFDLPVTIWSRPKAVRVAIGSRFLWMPAVFHGRKALIRSDRIKRWGAGDGPVVTPEEKELLMDILTKKSRFSPWMKLIFLKEGESLG